MKRITLLIIILSSLIALPAFAAIINIPADYLTIQEGIDSSTDGDTVLVQPGTYVENINFNGHNIVLGSLFLTTGDTTYISETVIDGGSSGSVVTFESGEDASAIISGLTIRNGLSSEGGGIYCNNGSGPIISNNNIIFNLSEFDFSHGYGGGIYCIDSDPLIINNLLYENDSNFLGHGGGIYLKSSSATIVQNHIIDNRAGYGGGIYCRDNSLPTIRHNTIKDNFALDGGGVSISSYCNANIAENTIAENDAAAFGGGILVYEATPQITYNVIYNNDAFSGEGGGIFIERYCSPFIFANLIYNNLAYSGGSGIHSILATPDIINNTIVFNSSDWEGGGFYSGHYDPTLQNNIIWGNEPYEIFVSMGSPEVSYCDVQGGWEGEGNIDCDPIFCDPESGDYHLHFSSCCIGTGENGTDIGAFSAGCGVPCGEYVVGDFNGDGEFNAADIIDAFSRLKTGQPQAALICECPLESGNNWSVAMDVNGSCAFNISDIIDSFSKFKTGSPELVPCEHCPPESGGP